MFHVVPSEQGKQNGPQQSVDIVPCKGQYDEDERNKASYSGRGSDDVKVDSSKYLGALLATWPLSGYALYRVWLSITQHERLLLDPANWDAEAMQVVHLATSAGLLLSAVVIAFSMRQSEKRLIDSRILYWVAPLLFVIGTALCAAAGNGWMEPSVQVAREIGQNAASARSLSLAVLTILVIGGLMAGVGSSFAFVMWGELLCSLEHRAIRAVALAQLALPAVAALFAPAPYVLNAALALLAPIGCFVCLGVMRKRTADAHVRETASACDNRRSRKIKPSKGLIVGIAVICAGYGFLQTTLTLGYGPGLRTDACTLLSFLMAFAIAFAVFDRVDDPDHVRSLRIVVSMLVLGFLLYPLGTHIAIRFISAVLVNCGFFLLEYLLMAALPELVSHVAANPAAVFGSARIVVTGGVLAGMTVAYAFLAFVPEAHQNATACSIVTLVSVSLLSWTGIWLLSTRNMHRFFWGEEAMPGYLETTITRNEENRLEANKSALDNNPSIDIDEGGQEESKVISGESGSNSNEYSKHATESRTSLDRRCVLLGSRCGLTAREQEVLILWAHGRSSPYIQETLVISANTVASHTKHIYQKIGVHSRQELLDELALVQE